MLRQGIIHCFAFYAVMVSRPVRTRLARWLYTRTRSFLCRLVAVVEPNVESGLGARDGARHTTPCQSASSHARRELSRGSALSLRVAGCQLLAFQAELPLLVEALREIGLFGVVVRSALMPMYVQREMQARERIPCSLLRGLGFNAWVPAK